MPQDTVSKLRQLRDRAKTTQTAVAEAKAASSHATRELSAAREELEALDLGGTSLDMAKPLTLQIEGAIIAANQELTDAEGILAEVNDVLRSPETA